MRAKTTVFISLVYFIHNTIANLSEPNADPGELLEIRDGEPCEEGKMYKKDCNTCTCQGSSLICSKMACLNFTMPNSRRKHRKKAKRSGDDINKLLLVSDREFLTLPSLSHHAAECKPSEIYKVDCNVCYCNTKKNLICDKKMCVDIKYTREIEARKLSGKPCKKMDSNKCIKCKCKKSKTFCQSIEDCETEDDQLILANKNGNSPRLAFNHTVEECKPSFVYKEKCNRCYCQPDRSLRCTSKLCLNYEQAMRLEEQRKYLEKHGL